jgi:hypothetical protein
MSDSVEVTVLVTDDGAEASWRIAVETFSYVNAGITGQQVFSGDGLSIPEGVWFDLRQAVTNQLQRLVTSELGIHCLLHELIYCEECRTVIWEPGPFD